MNWNQLEYILTVAEEKNITHAAERLHITQPSLSMSIKALEREFDVTLFERHQGELQLTYAGQLFCKWAQSTLCSYQAMSTKLHDIAHQRCHFFSLGISPHRSSILLPPILSQFYQQYPNCELQIVEHPTHILRQLLEERKLDIIIDIPHPDTINYENTLLVQERVILAIPVSFAQKLSPAILQTGQIFLSQLSQFPFILLPPNQVLGAISRKMCDAVSFFPNVRLTCISVERALALASEQLGITFVPEIFAHQHRFNDKIVYCTVNGFQSARELCLIHQKNLYQPQALQSLIQIFQTTVPAIYQNPDSSL